MIRINGSKMKPSRELLDTTAIVKNCFRSLKFRTSVVLREHVVSPLADT